jgi:hypothetical protein
MNGLLVCATSMLKAIDLAMVQNGINLGRFNDGR